MFWGLVLLLLASSALFARGALHRKAAIVKPSVTIETGAVVRLEKVVDGDTILVRVGDETASVRIVGIKAFDPDLTKDPFAVYGKEAVAQLTRVAGEKRIRVMAHVPAKDKHGRILATLYVDDQDLALGLVRDGLAMVYTAFPFPQMQSYLREQAAARVERKGLWGDPAAAIRADALGREWREEAP